MFYNCQQILTPLVVLIAYYASEVACKPTPQENSQQHLVTATRVRLCREGCLEKFATNSSFCQQQTKCSSCWNGCRKVLSTKLVKSIRETWSLRNVSMVQHDSLVLVDLAWDKPTLPTECLVTWEVSGGGLMGNLLTESFTVQLSLWPDTKYRVQVTCKNKFSGSMSRSLPLSINTSDAMKSVATLSPIGTPARSDTAVSHILVQSPFVSTAAVLWTNKSPKSKAYDETNTNVLPYNSDDQLRYRNVHFSWYLSGDTEFASSDTAESRNSNLQDIMKNTHKSLLFGSIAGISLLILLILIILCPSSCLDRGSDRVKLLVEDLNDDAGSTLPPTATDQIGSCRPSTSCSRNTLRV